MIVTLLIIYFSPAIWTSSCGYESVFFHCFLFAIIYSYDSIHFSRAFCKVSVVMTECVFILQFRHIRGYDTPAFYTSCLSLLPPRHHLWSKSISFLSSVVSNHLFQSFVVTKHPTCLLEISVVTDSTSFLIFSPAFFLYIICGYLPDFCLPQRNGA